MKRLGIHSEDVHMDTFLYELKRDIDKMLRFHKGSVLYKKPLIVGSIIENMKHLILSIEKKYEERVEELRE